MILFVLISLSCVSAVDNQTNVNAQVDVKVEETLTDVSTDEGNFTALNELISQSENELTLDKNYKFNLSTDKDFDGFTITKDNYVVDGKGHTIDGSNQVRIFIFTGSNITLKNLNIINANGTNGPAAYFASLAMIDNCSFINNTATNQGGAIYINNSISTLLRLYISHGLARERNGRCNCPGRNRPAACRPVTHHETKIDAVPDLIVGKIGLVIFLPVHIKCLHIYIFLRPVLCCHTDLLPA